jgi:FSR family fosmidomycin resistance protein-like MFS transporter
MAQREADLTSFAVAAAPSVAPPEPPAAPDQVASPPPDDEDIDIGPRERQLILWLTNVSHGVNHFQGQMLTPLYPLLMTDLRFGFVQLGLISAINNIVMNGMQFIYGFITPFMQRTRLLGFGYLIMCAGTLLTGLANSWTTLVGARVLMGIGGSGQHPVGASLLSSYFPKRRGAILALNSTIANVGTMLAPVVAGVAVAVVGWRHLMWLVAIPSILIGVAYFLVKDRQRIEHTAAPSKANLAKSAASYRRALRNRNMMIITIVFAVGAAGRGGQGVQLYLAPHLMRDFHWTVAIAGLALTISQAGGLVGPIVLGWLSDRLSRPAVLQASLLASFLATQWVAHQGPVLLSLGISLFIFGAFVSSRNTLTQALVADSVADEDQDAAFSIYFTLGFVAGPIMAIIEGVMMQRFGFTTMFSWTSLTYLVGIVLFFFAEDTRKRQPVPEKAG